MRSAPHSWEFYRDDHMPEDANLIFLHGSILGFGFGDTIALFHATRGFFAEVKDLESAEMIAWSVVMLEAVYLGDESQGHTATDQLVYESADDVLRHYVTRIGKAERDAEQTAES